jgi:hypothetical protein
MTLIVAPAMSDDSGTKTDGTIVDKAFIEALIALVDDQTHSAGNSTVKPKTITDEVIAGRGASASLDARFDAIDLLVTDLTTRLTTDVTVAGNIGVGEDNLFLYTVPANTLTVNGELIEFTVYGATTNNANVKTLRVYFGATLIGSFALTINSAALWKLSGVIIRTGAATQLGRSEAIHTFTAPPIVSSGTPAETLSGAVVLKVTGEATANNDITVAALIVKKAG